MIESEEKRKKLYDVIDRWSEFTLIKPYLRQGDVSGLVESILQEFYHITLSCGHEVRDFEDGIVLEFEDFVAKENKICKIQGNYCKDCAEEMIKELGARKV